MIAKLVRRLDLGVDLDVDMPRHLARVGFAHAPGLIGHFDVALADGVANAVVVHEALANEGDLWTRLADHPDQATSIAELLGGSTAALHPGLSAGGDGFEAEPMSVTAQRAELDAVRRSLVETQRMLGDRSAALTAVEQPAESVRT